MVRYSRSPVSTASNFNILNKVSLAACWCPYEVLKCRLLECYCESDSDRFRALTAPVVMEDVVKSRLLREMRRNCCAGIDPSKWFFQKLFLQRVNVRCKRGTCHISKIDGYPSCRHCRRKTIPR
ncbi:hypothetical protein T09_10061 [Trichinella sp. T9]|nr:hypothetical protein T09_10061 [Trichinella sp. T9]